MIIPPIETRMKELLEATAAVVRPCRRCGATIYFVRPAAREGVLMPYTADGVNHFLNCPHAGRKAQQAAMFDTSPLPQ